MLNADHHKLDIICNAVIAYICSSTSILATQKKICKGSQLATIMRKRAEHIISCSEIISTGYK
jgi:hypothetical protein